MAISAKLTRALNKGDRSYDTFLGEWWYRKSWDIAHRRAYLQITEFVHRHFKSHRQVPRVVVDYACGNGGCLGMLARRFPSSRIVGIDGSERMLELAGHDLNLVGVKADWVSAARAFDPRGGRVRLVKLALPDFSLASHTTNAVLFLFPNMNFTATLTARIRNQIFGDRSRRNLARFLSRMPNLDSLKDKTPPEQIYEDLLYERAVSRNIHQILKPGGWLFKVDYSNCLRKDLSELSQWRMQFGECALDAQIQETPHRDPFELVKNDYMRSGVILDVYEQTHKKTDRRGGYMITTFRAR